MKIATLHDGEEIRPLTGLRFIAAFYVFLFHIQIRWPLVQHQFGRNIIEQGAIGMSLFFMLSGFVLAYRYADGHVDVKDYLVNRFARIYPIYITAALATIPWIGVDFSSGSLHDTVRGIGQGAMLIFANIFLIQAWFPQFFSYWNDGGSWSISVEAFCYILLPFILPALSRLSYKQIICLAGFCCFIGAVVGLSAKLFNTPSATIFYSVPVFRLPDFLIGACLYLLLRSGRVREFGTVAQAAAILAFIVYLGIKGAVMPFYIGHDWIALPFIAFMILSLSIGKGPFAYLLSSRVFVWLGRISYSFYAFQALIVLLLIQYHDVLVSQIPVLSNNRVLALDTFLVLTLLSAIGHHLIEEPSRRWIRRRYHTARMVGFTNIASCTIKPNG